MWDRGSVAVEDFVVVEVLVVWGAFVVRGFLSSSDLCREIPSPH